MHRSSRSGLTRATTDDRYEAEPVTSQQCRALSQPPPLSHSLETTTTTERTTRAQTDRYGNWFDPAPNCCQRLLRERSSSQYIISGTKCHFPGSVLTVFSSNTEFDGMTSNVSSGVSSSDPEVSWRQFKPLCADGCCDEMEEEMLAGKSTGSVVDVLACLGVG